MSVMSVKNERDIRLAIFMDFLAINALILFYLNKITMQEILRKTGGNIEIPELTASGVCYIVNGFRRDIYEGILRGLDLPVFSIMNKSTAF